MTSISSQHLKEVACMTSNEELLRLAKLVGEIDTQERKVKYLEDLIHDLEIELAYDMNKLLDLKKEAEGVDV